VRSKRAVRDMAESFLLREEKRMTIDG
jgi:hypothetical protein